jgi:hypothetical protein
VTDSSNSPVADTDTDTDSTGPETDANSDSAGKVRLAVLNPGGRDRPVNYANGPGTPQQCASAGIHPPINYHAYAAATRGDLLDSTRAALDGDYDAVLVLIRRRVGASLKAVAELKKAGRTVLVAWKEAGPYQITQQLGSSKLLADYQDILALADGVLSPCSVLPPRWGWISAADFANKTRYIPTPYPLEFAEWNFGQPTTERKGIFIGTREFFTATRSHLRALAESATLASELGVPVTVINGDKRAGRRILRHLEQSFPESRLRIIRKPLPFIKYLELIASHRLVFQLDRGAVPGQVAGDALMCRTLCVGGNTAIERLVFTNLAVDASGSLQNLFGKIRTLMSDGDAYQQAVTDSQTAAMEKLSFGAVARQLAEFVGEVRNGS